MTITMCATKTVAGCDDTYWADGTAAAPVLLIDDATQAITEAVYRIRYGSVLDHRDVAAAGAALADLLGGLNEVAQLCTTAVSHDAGTGLPRIGRPHYRWQTLRSMMLSAQQVAFELEPDGTAVPPGGGHKTVPFPRDERS